MNGSYYIRYRGVLLNNLQCRRVSSVDEMTVPKRATSGEDSLSKKPKLITEFFAQAKEKKPVKKTIKKSEKPVVEAVKLLEVEQTQEQHAELNEQTRLIASEKPKPSQDVSQDPDYEEFCARHGFNKAAWIGTLTPEEKQLLSLEINTLHITWLTFLHKELTKPYFIKLKKFLRAQAGKTVFPPPGRIYSWSHFTPLPDVKCLILGQDPYHNFNQAHGLAFLVLEPTRPPPSLLNIYKTLKIDFPSFEAPDYNSLSKAGKPGGGNLTKWAKRGVLMLNACLTVEAHKANSHANQGWEQFTEQVISTAIKYARDYNEQGFVVMAWGTPAQKRVAKFSAQMKQSKVPFFVLESVHPSPLSARRGFFELQVFKKCNAWLDSQGKQSIDWGLIEGNVVTR